MKAEYKPWNACAQQFNGIFVTDHPERLDSPRGQVRVTNTGCPVMENVGYITLSVFNNTTGKTHQGEILFPFTSHER